MDLVAIASMVGMHIWSYHRDQATGKGKAAWEILPACCQSALPEKVVIAHFSIIVSSYLHPKILIMPVYMHFDPDVQLEYVFEVNSLEWLERMDDT